MIVHPSLLAGVGVVIAAALTFIGVLLGHQASRIAALERRVDCSDDYSRRLWTWARDLLDLYFRHRKDGAPDPPPIPVRDDEG